MRTIGYFLLGLFCLAVLGCGGCGLVAVAWYADQPADAPCPNCPAPTPVAPPLTPKPKPTPPPCPNCPRFGDLVKAGFEQFQVGGPELDGVSVACDMPSERFVLRRNVGGSDGAGLCVYASSLNAADWTALRQMVGFWKWLQRRPGGSYPPKFAADVAEYCREAGIPEPQFVQITNNDIAFLEEATANRVMLGVTYSGEDGVFYRQKIAHMVNLVYFSREKNRAAIVDNNNPDKILWMSADEFLKRWSGWALSWLAAPPPPVPTLEAAP